MPSKLKHELLPLSQIESTGSRIARIRKQRGFTQHELGERIGILHSLVSDYERGRLKINDEMIVRFSLALSVTTDELLGLREMETGENGHISLRVARRMKQIDELPEGRKKAILRTFDDLIRANS